MNIYDIAIAPGAARQIDVQADYIYFRTGSAGGGDTTVVFQPISGGEAVYLQPGQAYKMPAALRGKNVSWILRNLKGESTIAGVLLMGEGEFQDNRVSGAVEVIDGGRNRTMANQAFDGSAYAGAAVGMFPHVQLYNPPNSGRRVVIKRIGATRQSGGAVGVTISQTMLADLQYTVSSKLSGGAPSVAQLRAAQRAAPPAEQGIASLSLQAGVLMERLYQEPVVLLPGWGLTLWSNVTNTDVNGAYEFVEELIG